MGTAPTGVSHTGRNAGLVSVVVVAVIVAAGFVVMVPVSSVAQVPVAVVNTVETTFVTSSVTQVPVSQSGTATSALWDESDISLQPNYYDSYSATLTVGTDAQVSWQASGTVNVYVFTSAQYNAYRTSGTTSPDVASASSSSDSLTFHISGTDTYYLVIENPNGGFLGIGATNVGYTSSGSETYPTTSTTYITQTVTYTTSSPTVVTTTSTSTTTKTCSYNFWAWLTGSHSCS